MRPCEERLRVEMPHSFSFIQGQRGNCCRESPPFPSTPGACTTWAFVLAFSPVSPFKHFTFLDTQLNGGRERGRSPVPSHEPQQPVSMSVPLPWKEKVPPGQPGTGKRQDSLVPVHLEAPSRSSASPSRSRGLLSPRWYNVHPFPVSCNVF